MTWSGIYMVEEGYFEFGNFETCYFEFKIELFWRKKTKTE